MPDRNRRNLLSECNLNGAPLAIFSAECCARCINPECTLSMVGNTKFDLRVNTWEERLFTKVPRMSQQDPRFTMISGQKFLAIDTSRMPEVHTGNWIDPQDLEKPQPPPPSIAPSAPPTEALSEVPPTSGRKVIPRHMLLANAPPQAGKMLQTGSVPPVDRWAGPVAPPSTVDSPPAPIVKPGARVKLRGSGV